VIYTNKSSTTITDSFIKRCQSTCTSTSGPSSSNSPSTSPNDPLTSISANHNLFDEKRKDDVTLVKPEKEWVLPQRAKSGRKPSQVEPPTMSGPVEILVGYSESSKADNSGQGSCQSVSGKVNEEAVVRQRKAVLIPLSSLIDLQSLFSRQKRKAQNRASQRAFREVKQIT